MPEDIARFLRTHELLESSVLDLAFDDRQRRLVLVIDFAHNTVSRWLEASAQGRAEELRQQRLPREFYKLDFRGVEGVSISSDLKPRPSTPEDLRALAHRQDICIMQARLRRLPRRPMITIHMTSVSIAFAFETFRARYRRAMAHEQTGLGQWRYHDHDAGEDIDFYKPFGDPLSD